MPSLGSPLALGLGGVADPALNNISKLLVAFGQSVQALEDAAQQVLTQRSLDTAVGTQLDVLGKIVGQPRNGLDDDTYRRYCRASISANRSNGTTENLLRVAALVVFDPLAHFESEQQATATVSFRVQGIALSLQRAITLFAFLARTASSGIRLMLEYGLSPPAQCFRFNSGPGFNAGHLIARIDH